MSIPDILTFSWDNRFYVLKFMAYPIIQLKGDTASGKSLLVSDFRNASEITPTLQNSLVIDSQSRKLLPYIRQKCYDYVIIDNADILITDDIDAFIYQHILDMQRTVTTRYILIGRKVYMSVIAPMCTGRLIQRKKGSIYSFSIDYSGIV